MMTFTYILIGVLALVLLLYVIAPSRYDVSRSILINRQPGAVFEYLKYLKNQDEWSPWSKRDPDMKKEFRGTDGTPGFVSSWEGNKEVGSGEQEITGIEEGTRIESQLRFLKPWKSTSDAYIEVEPAEGDATRVRWGFSGQNGFPMRLMMLVISMDKMVGKDFEEGLATLKARLENKKQAEKPG